MAVRQAGLLADLTGLKLAEGKMDELDERGGARVQDVGEMARHRGDLQDSPSSPQPCGREPSRFDMTAHLKSAPPRGQP